MSCTPSTDSRRLTAVFRLRSLEQPRSQFAGIQRFSPSFDKETSQESRPSLLRWIAIEEVEQPAGTLLVPPGGKEKTGRDPIDKRLTACDWDQAFSAGMVMVPDESHRGETTNSRVHIVDQNRPQTVDRLIRPKNAKGQRARIQKLTAPLRLSIKIDGDDRRIANKTTTNNPCRLAGEIRLRCKQI